MQKKIFNNREKYSFNQSTKHNYIEPLKNLTRIRNCLQLFIRFASYETVSQSILTNRFVQKKIVFTHDSRFFFEKSLKSRSISLLWRKRGAITGFARSLFIPLHFTDMERSVEKHYRVDPRESRKSSECN